MLSKFFPVLKPKEYSVQVLNDNTSQSAVKRIKRTRTKAPFKKIATVALVLSLLGGGLASAIAGTGVTASQAHAGNIFTDMVCISGDSDGSWNSGANVYGIIGGRAEFSMSTNSIVSKTIPSDRAIHGFAGDWGGPTAPSGGQYLTAYEKYGMLYPIYDAWVPVFSDKDTTIKQVDSSKSTYSADGKIPTLKDGNKVASGSSPLVTSNVGSCMALLPSISAAVANMIAVLPRFVMGASIELYSASYGASMSNKNSVLYVLGQSIDKFITQPGGLKDSLFIPFIPILLLIGAIWVGYVGIVKRAAMHAVQSTAWMIVAIALGTVFLAQPTLIASFTDDIVANVQGVINQAVLSSSKASAMCDLNGAQNISNSVSADPNDPKVGKIYDGTPVDTAPTDTSLNITLRETQCTIWQSTIYSTWVAGQFGVSANSASSDNSVLTQSAGRKVLNTDKYAIAYGSSNLKQAQTWPQFMLDREVTTKSPELSEVAWAQLSGGTQDSPAKINADWGGSLGMIPSAILMFFGAGASSAVLFTYGFALLIYQLMMISAVLMSPFFFLFGIVPNWGRRVLMRYAELIASLVMKRIVTGTLLAFYLVFYTLIIGDAKVDMLLLKILIVACLALFFITSRNKFIKMFADNINFGGNKSIGLPGNKAAAITGAGVGLLAGGLIGAGIGGFAGHKARKQNKDMEGDLKNIKLDGGNPTADIKTPPRGPNTGGDGDKKNINPAKVLNQTVSTAGDLQKTKKFLDKTFTNKSPEKGTQAPQGGPNGNTGSSTSTAPNAPSAPSMTPQASGVGGAGPTVAPAGSGTAAASAGGTAASGAAASGAAASGAAAVGVGAAAGGTAAAGGVAATGGAVAAGAAAGSVVPVVGTVVGAVAGAAAVAAKQYKDKKKEEEGN